MARTPQQRGPLTLNQDQGKTEERDPETGWLLDRDSGMVMDPVNTELVTVPEAKRRLADRNSPDAERQAAERQAAEDRAKATQAAPEPSSEPAAAPVPPPAGGENRLGVGANITASPVNPTAEATARNQAMAMEPAKPIPGAVVSAAIAASREAPQPAVAAPGEETVTCVFPRKVLLTLPDHRKLSFEVGPNEVPVSLAGTADDNSDMHFWLKSNGVIKYKKSEFTKG